MLTKILFNEDGNVIFMVLLFSILVTVLGLTSYYVATTELTQSSSKYETAKALYLAEGGLERALVEMTSGMDDGWDDEVAGVDGEKGTDDDGILSFGPTIYCEAPLQGGYQAESEEVSSVDRSERFLGHYKVKVKDGRIPGRQTGVCNKAVLQSTGISSKDFKREVEAEIEIFDLPPSPSTVFVVPGPTTTDFPDPDFSGQSWTIDGNDTNPDGTPGSGPSVPGIACNTTVVPIINSLKDNQKDQVMGTGYDAATSPISPSIQITDVEVNLIEIVQKLKGMADNTITPGTYSSSGIFGSSSDYQITVCDGDLHLTGQMDGCGVLVVNGDFTMSGKGTWNGYIIVLGDARFTGGGNTFALYGTLMLGSSSRLASGGAHFDICGNSDLLYSTKTIENARTDVRTVTVNRWGSVAAK